MLAISSQCEEDENELSYTRRKVTVHSQSTTNLCPTKPPSVQQNLHYAGYPGDDAK